MKIKDGFILREAAGNYVVMNLGGELSFDGMITLNETGALIWNAINDGKSKEDIAAIIAGEYEIDLKTALADTENFIKKMSEADVFE